MKFSILALLSLHALAALAKVDVSQWQWSQAFQKLTGAGIQS
jgi:hypothetical protein